MKKKKIYLDTSIIGGCFDEEFQEYSNKIIHDVKIGFYQGVISDITIDEINQAPEHIINLLRDIPEENMTILSYTDEVANLAQNYLDENILTENYEEDAFHIAFATVYNVDVLISWNFKHIVNFSRINQFNAVNSKQGYKPLEIRSPRELFYED